MSDAVITRCPGCRTAFRVTPGQLALREGQVRCGQCRAVFDANDHLVAGEGRKPEAAPVHEAVTPEPQAEPAVAATQAPAAVEPETVPAEAPDAPEPAVAAAESPVAPEPTFVDPPAPAGVDEGVTPRPVALDRARAYEWRPRKRLHEQPKALYAFAILALVALLGAQGLFEYRDTLAAHAPFTRPLLDAACRAAGCSIAPLRDASALFIEASDLEADPAHKGLLKLSATVRNRASYPIAYPYLELTLTDAADHVVARRAFPPATYAAPDASGIAPNGEVLVRLFLDASATSQAGYRVYLFYP
jgi:predicted Zn finger-like uncharacterized protein